MPRPRSFPRQGTVFVHVPLSHTFTIQVVGGDGGPFYVLQAGRTCGLREGDLVMAVDGASTTRWPLALLQQTLRRASRDVVVEVLREMGDSAATIGVLTGGTELGAATLNHHHHHTVTKAVHEAEDLPVVSENGKLEPIVESPQGAPASPASPSASPPCSPSVTPPATPDTEVQAVTSSQTSHTKTLESAVSLQSAGGGLQGAVQSQDVQNLASQSQAIHSQSIQSGSVSQSHITTTNGIQPVQISTAISGQPTLHSVSQSHTTQAVSQSHSAQTVVQSHAAVGSNGQPLSVPDVTAEQPRLEPPSVDENANSIPEVSAVPHTEPVPEAFVAQEANEEPVPAVTSEPSAAPEPAVVTEPAATPEQAVVTEPAAGPEPVTEPKPAVVEIPAVTPESAEATEEAVIQELDMPTETAMVETMVDAQESAPNYEPESLLVTEETAAPEPQPARMPIHEEAPSSYTPEPVPALKSEPSPEADPCVETVVSGGDCPVVEEISQEHIKEQLHEIITEIEQEVLPEQEQEQELEQQQQQEVQQRGCSGGVAQRDTKPCEEAWPVAGEAGCPLEAEEVEYYDEDGSIKHTWKPRGRYEVPKTVVQYEDVVPIPVPDVAFSLKPEPPKPAPPPQPEPPKPQPAVETRQVPSSLTNGDVTPIEIPEGIPLLARILPPKETEDGERKISLERLFTPATDSGDLTPHKKAFASSSFYRPDHPTMDDQVELAQRISFSLVDENNKKSRGQSMYMKRKKRSMRWIHAGSGEGGDGQEEDYTLKHPPAKPAMKLLMNPKGVQDFHAVQEHYQNLMDSAVPTSPELIGKIVMEVQSPTGKGAELFAKRKKRMDKFIVDETTVQKAHNTNTSARTQQQPTTNDTGFKKSAVEERNRQQHQIMEQFLRSREQSLTLLKSPWQATMETGTPDAAFDDKRQRIKLANTVCDRADTMLADQSWLEPPKPMPLVTPSMPAEVTATPAVQPVVPHRSMLSPASDESNKRNSVSFNMAAKGWGTYNNFYSPVTFAT